MRGVQAAGHESKIPVC